MATGSLPAAALLSHIGVVGKTGSGKTSTTKLVVEQVVAEGGRVCILDPIKSDWWGIISSADGKKEGLPFQILGGPHGHVPLHESAGAAVAELVASGQLPLSVIDMADFGPGGLQRFFVDFAAVLFKKNRAPLHLVIEEAHEFAPKERAGMGAENMAIYWAKKLATGGRSKGIRLVPATQRTQALHNAVLGSCETLIVHRLTLPADQAPVLDWLKAHLNKSQREAVAGSLGKLATGTGWLVSGEAELCEQIAFPRISTYDNTKTPDGTEMAHKVKSAPVDAEGLRAILSEAVKEAEANDPKLLQIRVRALTKELDQAKKASGASPVELQAAEQRGAERGKAEGYATAANDVANDLEHLVRKYRSWAQQEKDQASKAAVVPNPVARPATASPTPVTAQRAAAPAKSPAKPATVVKQSGQLAGPQQRIVNAIAWWDAIGVPSPTRTQVAIVAGYSPQGGGFLNPLGSLRTAGLIEYPAASYVCLTHGGKAVACSPESPPSESELHRRILDILDGPRRKILQPLLDAYPADMSRAELAAAAGYEPGGGGFLNPLGALRSLGLIDYPTKGQVIALPILFLER